jgi:hypothetical protein
VSRAKLIGAFQAAAIDAAGLAVAVGVILKILAILAVTPAVEQVSIWTRSSALRPAKKSGTPLPHSGFSNNDRRNAK